MLHQRCNVDVEGGEMAETEASRARQLALSRLAPLNIAQDQMARYVKKFDAFDLNKDGIVSLREFAAVSRVFGYNLTRDEVLVSQHTTI